MMINDSKQFREIIPYKGPILGIDLGTKRIGMAISDINQKIASPFKVEENKNFSEILNVLKKIRIDRNICCLLYTSPSPRDS